MRQVRLQERNDGYGSRINAAARMNGTTYSKMIAGLKKANVTINRKMLADLAVNDPKAFTEIAEISKKA